MEDVKICYNYVELWLFSDDDTIAPMYLELHKEKLPQHPDEWLAWQISHDKYGEYKHYNRAKMTLKTHKDKRRVLDRAFINLNTYYDSY